MIAFDAFTDLGSTTGTTLTTAHTVTGTDPFLVVGVDGDVSTDNISGVTYNGVAMTQLDKYHMFAGADRWAYAFYLANPATGTHNVVISSNPSGFIAGMAASYSGAAGGLDANNTSKSDSSGVATLDNSVTSVADNCWHIGSSHDASGNAGAGTNTTQRGTANGGNMQIIDNNAAIHPAGSNTIQMTLTGGIQAGPVIFGLTISPTAGGGFTLHSLSTTGAGK